MTMKFLENEYTQLLNAKKQYNRLQRGFNRLLLQFTTYNDLLFTNVTQLTNGNNDDLDCACCISELSKSTCV
jgi:hypothetical protein